MFNRKILLPSLLLLFMISSCADSSKTANGITLQGEVAEVASDSLYLYEVVYEHYNYVVPVAAFPIDKDGTFKYHNDTIASKLYYITDKSTDEIGYEGKAGHYLFLLNGVNKVEIEKAEEGTLSATIIDAPLHDRYKAYKAKERALGNADALEALYAAFYQARDAGDNDKIDEINATIEPLHDEGEQRVSEWLDSLMRSNQYGLFDLYLFYSKVFQVTTYDTIEEINEVRAELERYDEEAQSSAYAKEIKESLQRQEYSAVGMPAPEIYGQTPKGETIYLSELKGSYVLLDFWSSGCSWCRLETPYLKEAYQNYSDKGFTILCISSDVDEKAWLQAIEEDATQEFKHIILSRDDRNKIFSDYSIIGIPQIILVSPEGIILARNLRGEAISEAIATHITE